MLFVELRFFAFFAVVFCVYWFMQSNRRRKVWLLACSYVFYAAWDWRFLSLLILTTTLDYTVGIQIPKQTEAGGRRRWLLVSLCGNLGLLGFFKYFNFFAESLAELGAMLGVPLSRTTLEIVLPVGISFYTFQEMSYALDIYLGKLKPTRSFLDVSLFVGFFPHMVAGPILRASNFLPQFLSSRSFLWGESRAFLLVFLVGFLKKACVADNLAPIVDQYFSDPGSYDASSAWTAVLFYAVQIYCDFSGYSDMAIGAAGLLGYRLCKNFDAPYLAGNITDFWRRWHISLSTWLKDYLYVSLGGNRGSKLFTYRNLMATMLLGGLWHGASWNFVVWGGMHGAALVFHKEWSALVSRLGAARRVFHFLGPAITFYWVCVTWIVFRSGTLREALDIGRSFVLLESPGAKALEVNGLLIVSVLALVHWLTHRKLFDSWWRGVPAPLFFAGYGAVFAAAVALMPMGHRPFIYFQF